MGRTSIKNSGKMEYTMESIANYQFKFLAIGDSSTIIANLLTVCELLSIKCGSFSKFKIEDIYVDDNQFTFLNNKCSIRKRIQNGKILITFKTVKEDSQYSALERLEEEFECSEEDYNRMRENNFKDEIEYIFYKKFHVFLTCSALEEVIKVSNERISIPIKTDISEYIFSFDKYFYSDFQNEFSEYFGEIEIEGKFYKKDDKLSKLIKALSMLLEYKPHKKGKYEKGMEWHFNKGKDLKIVYSVMFDIVGYSKFPGNVQKQIIQSLNRVTKKVIREFKVHEIGKIVYIPIGDGMIMVFEDNPQYLIRYVFNIQERIKEEYNKFYPSSKFEFRTGIHCGPVFKYSDVNENLNFAGSGINLVQRVTNIGDKWHILATKEAYDNIADIDNTLKDYFHEIDDEYEIKGGVKMKVYNIFDNHKHGNPITPKANSTEKI